MEKGNRIEGSEASPALRAIDPEELETRFAALRASNYVVRSLCDSKGYDLRGLLDGFSGRPDLYEQVLDKLQIREVTMFVDEAPVPQAPGMREAVQDALYRMRNVLDKLSWYSSLSEIRENANDALKEIHFHLGIGYEASGRSSVEPPTPSHPPATSQEGK